MVDKIVVQQHRLVGEVFHMQINMALHHLHRPDLARAVAGVALAPGAEGADVDQLHPRVAVEFFAVRAHEPFQLVEENRIAVIRFIRAVGAERILRARRQTPISASRT